MLLPPKVFSLVRSQSDKSTYWRLSLTSTEASSFPLLSKAVFFRSNISFSFSENRSQENIWYCWPTVRPLRNVFLTHLEFQPMVKQHWSSPLWFTSVMRKPKRAAQQNRYQPRSPYFFYQWSQVFVLWAFPEFLYLILLFSSNGRLCVDVLCTFL